MEQLNNKQDRIIFEIEALLNKMSNQVNFLIRKEMPMNQLDVDLLMENTRKLYDTICSVELGVRDEELGIEEEDDSEVIEFEDENEDTEEEIIDFEEDDENDEDNDYVVEEDDEYEDEYNDEDDDDDNDEDNDDADMVWDFTKSEEELGVRNEELGVEEDFDNDDNIGDNLDDDTEGVDSSDEEIIEPKKEEKEEDSGIRAYRIVRDNIPTLGDMLEQSEDKSLAARLQRKPVSDLVSAIGINDKFLFLNELFGGSMEKYNKSIRSLNSFSTLLGAKTYMSELQIEFQWDCTSDAYKKLNDLVERRFI